MDLERSESTPFEWHGSTLTQHNRIEFSDVPQQ